MSEGTRTIHPEPDRLVAYTLGRLGRVESAEIERHLAACDACRGALPTHPIHAGASLPHSRGAPQGGAADDPAVPATVDLSIPSSFITSGPAPSAATETLDATPPPARAVPGLPAALIDHPRYRILGVLGAGGMGAVYLAEHRVMERRVALKVVRPDLLGNAALVERFRREVKAAARLSHPNVVAAFDAEQAGDAHMLVMEYVEGTDLGRHAMDRGPLPAAESCEYVRQAALGLQHAHEQGMVHRDVKPQNLMLATHGGVKVLDFGLSRFASEVASNGGLTSDRAVLGTADYIAPEQASDARGADIRADIYSLGCTLYHLLAGQPPFPGGTLMQKLMAHAQQPPRPLDEVRDDLPAGLSRVVARMMAKDPAARYQTPAEVARALTRFAPGGPADPDPPADEAIAVAKRAVTVDRSGVGQDGAESGRPPRRPWKRLVAMLAALALLTGAAAWMFRDSTPADTGTLLVKTNDREVEVVVRRAGEVVAVVDPKFSQSVVLRTGEYQLGLGRGRRDHVLAPTAVSLKRGRVEVVHVAPTPRGGAAGPAADAAGNPEIGRFLGPKSPIVGLAFAPDGRRFLSGGMDRSLRLCQLPSGRLVERYKPLSDSDSLAFTPDGDRFVTANSEGRVMLWDVGRPAEPIFLDGWHTSGRICVAFSPDGRRVASGGAGDRKARVWDVTTSRPISEFVGHEAAIRAVAFLPDNAHVLTADLGGALRIWEAETGQLVRAMGDPEGVPQFPRLSDLALSSDGRRALVGGKFSGHVTVWDVERGRILHSILWDAVPLGLPNIDPTAVAIAPDGRRGLAGTQDGWLRLWDLDTGREIDRFDAGRSDVRSVAIARDGRLALSGGGDGSISLWRLPDPSGEARGTPPKLIEPAADATLPNGHRGSAAGTLWAFRWSPVERAAQYHLYIVPQEGKDRPRVDIDDLVAASYRYALGGSIEQESFLRGWRWRVRAKVDGAWGPWSEERAFQVEPPGPPPHPVGHRLP